MMILLVSFSLHPQATGFSPHGGLADLCTYFTLSGPCCLCHGRLALLLLLSHEKQLSHDVQPWP